MTALIIDTETSDKDEGMEVLEVAFQSWPTGDSFQSFYEPSSPIKFGAMGVHHILPEDLTGKGYAPSRDAYKSIPVGTQYLIGHNIDFDWKALGCPPIKRICTFAMARNLWPETDSHTLSALVYFLFGATPANRDRLRSAHSAAADVEFCQEILQVIMKVAKVGTLEELYTFSEDARIPRTMSFGKHKGKPISEVDRGYSNWYRKQPDTDPYLLEAFKRAGI